MSDDTVETKIGMLTRREYDIAQTLANVFSGRPVSERLSGIISIIEDMNPTDGRNQASDPRLFAVLQNQKVCPQ
jgi:hypothetical protein